MLIVCPELRSGGPGAPSIDAPPETEVVEMSDRAFNALTRRQNPDGVLAVAAIPSHSLRTLTLGTEPLVLVIEGIEKPGNVGAMLRTADAVGVDAVVAADPGVDFENPNLIRASQGSVFAVSTGVGRLDDVVDFLGAHGLRLVALSPDATTDLWDLDLTGPVAIAVGAEAEGISDRLRSLAVLARLPMAGAADSLNASVAAGVALYEAVRMRR